MRRSARDHRSIRRFLLFTAPCRQWATLNLAPKPRRQFGAPSSSPPAAPLANGPPVDFDVAGRHAESSPSGSSAFTGVPRRQACVDHTRRLIDRDQVRVLAARAARSAAVAIQREVRRLDFDGVAGARVSRLDRRVRPLRGLINPEFASG
jgi:hypothetical protein